MVRSAFRSAVAVLWAALATACLGGQTGQPSSRDCDATQLSSTSAWSGTTVQAAAQGFEGTYAAGLVWHVEPLLATTHTPVDLQDNVQLSITYGGGPAKRDCLDQLEVPVSVTLSTGASHLTDSGEGTLTLQRTAQALVASLHYESKLVNLSATLPEAAGAGTPGGSFEALNPDLPGASARFTEGP